MALRVCAVSTVDQANWRFTRIGGGVASRCRRCGKCRGCEWLAVLHAIRCRLGVRISVGVDANTQVGFTRSILDGLANMVANRLHILQALDGCVEFANDLSDRLHRGGVDLPTFALEQGKQRVGAVVVELGNNVTQGLNESQRHLFGDGEESGHFRPDVREFRLRLEAAQIEVANERFVHIGIAEVGPAPSRENRFVVVDRDRVANLRKLVSVKKIKFGQL
ncbi:hypothetical protein D9M68_755580 [compost metagenome]